MLIYTWNSAIPGYLQPILSGHEGYLSSPEAPIPISKAEITPSSDRFLNSIWKLLMKSK
jgi:hypothetical protein